MTLLAYAVLIGLAAFRLWRIFAEDKITERARDWLYDKAQSETYYERGVALRKDHRVWEFLADLMSCSWCIGWWWCGALSGIVTWHEGYDWPAFVLLWCAGSAICGLLKNLD